MTLRRAVLVLAAAVALTVPPATANATTTTMLTNADNGTSVSVNVGDYVAVHLSGSRGDGITIGWTVPQSSPAGILTLVKSSSTATDSYALFEASATGSATLNAQENCTASPGHVCFYALIRWTATVNVS
jgi:hypothetical protein